MERALSPEERIRRAEEVYQRRRSQMGGVRVTSNYTTTASHNSKPSYSLFRKMILQIAICLVIYLIFYLVQNTNYLFSDEVMSKTKEILSYDINFTNLYNGAMGYINEAKNKIEGKNDEQQPAVQPEENQTQNDTSSEENIGGASAEEGTELGQNEPETKPTENLSQMEMDANEIKTKYALIKPLEGTITSRFGVRNPTTPTVPKNHTGIDMAAKTGTVIQAALDGVVEIASSEGDYRKSFEDSQRRCGNYLCPL